MIEDHVLNEWFKREVLPLEHSLMSFIGRNWKAEAEIVDVRQEVYERVLIGARRELPRHVAAYLFTTARRHLINRAKRSQVIPLDLITDLENAGVAPDMLTPDRHLSAREELRMAQAGIDRLPPRCREVVLLRKVEGLSTREVAERLGVGIDTVEQQTVHGMRALADFMLGGAGKIQRPAIGTRPRRRQTT